MTRRGDYEGVLLLSFCALSDRFPTYYSFCRRSKGVIPVSWMEFGVLLGSAVRWTWGSILVQGLFFTNSETSGNILSLSSSVTFSERG